MAATELEARMAASGALEELLLMSGYKWKRCLEIGTVLLVPNFV